MKSVTFNVSFRIVKRIDRQPEQCSTEFQVLAQLSCEHIDSVMRKSLQSQLKRLCKNHEGLKESLKCLLNDQLDHQLQEWSDKAVLVVETILLYPFTVDLLDPNRLERLLFTLTDCLVFQRQKEMGDTTRQELEKLLKLCLALFATFSLTHVVQSGYKTKEEWFMSLFQSCKSILMNPCVFWDLPKYAGLLLMTLIQRLPLSDQSDCLLKSSSEPFFPILKFLGGSADHYGPLATAHCLLSVSIQEHFVSDQYSFNE
jgi:hypothetical protein